MDSPTEAFEHAEHAEHAAHSGNTFVANVAMTIAALAVLAVTVASLETIESGSAISAKSEAVLFQNQATDQWGFFQGKSLKKNMYDIATVHDPAHAEEFTAKTRKNEAEAQEVQTKARDLEHRSEERLHEGQHHEHRHHRLTLGATLLHIAIAIATISIITGGQRWPWFASLGLGVAGTVAAGTAYLI
jgi:hypothetical protein